MKPRKNKCLSISEKKRVIQAVEDGQLKKDVAKEFGILPSTLSMILKKKDSITGCALIASRKRSRLGDFPRLEECLLKWIRQCREKNIPIGGFMLKEKARFFAQSFGIEGFAASEGWLSNFKNRHGVTFKKFCGDRTSVDISICSQWIDKLVQVSLDEDHEEEPSTPVILSEARKCLTTLRFYALGNDVNDDYLAALTIIKNSLDSDKLKSQENL